MIYDVEIGFEIGPALRRRGHVGASDEVGGKGFECTRVGNSVVDFSSGLETDGVVKVGSVVWGLVDVMGDEWIRVVGVVVVRDAGIGIEVMVCTGMDVVNEGEGVVTLLGLVVGPAVIGVAMGCGLGVVVIDWASMGGHEVGICSEVVGVVMVETGEARVMGG